MTAILDAPLDIPKGYVPAVGQGVDQDGGYTLPRDVFIDVIDSVLATMGDHMHEYEQERLRELARKTSRVSFGIWGTRAGCPLEQTGLCMSAYRVDSVFELFIKYYDKGMQALWGLDPHTNGTVVIL
jgi:hypothetical protein